MSRLLGIVASKLPKDSDEYWIWRAQEIPGDARWDYERLIVETHSEQGNIKFRVRGEPYGQYTDGVFLNMYVNPDLVPEIALSEGQAPAISLSSAQAPDMPPAPASVATPGRLEGESQSQQMRRKATAMRWQAAQLDELAEKMEIAQAQGLI